GRLPHAHAPAQSMYHFEGHPLLIQTSLLAMVRMVRAAVAEHGEWRPVIDALRPHTPMLWQRLSLRDQRRFMARLSTFWNIHRHRMAPQIAAQMEAEIAAGTVRIVPCRRFVAGQEDT